MDVVTYPVPDLLPALPEMIMAVGAMVLLMVGVFRGDGSFGMVNRVAIALMLVTAFIVLLGPNERVETFSGAFVVDVYSKFLKFIVLIGAAAALLMIDEWFQSERFNRFELGILVVLAVLGMMMMISANDLIALYIGLELQSLALYVTASIQRDNLRSTEAGLKYFILGALSSGMLLYGCSLIYGFTGATSFEGIALAIADNGVGIGLIFGIVFLLAGLAFKISAVPFHMWTPDVYEGSPTPITAFFAAAPKVAAMAMTMRVLVSGFGGATPEWQQIIVFVSIASMILGAFAAIGQSNIKRLMAYSSIGHMGFALVGLAAGSEAGVQGVILYMTIYLATTLGTFAMILAMRREETPVETIQDLAGLSKSKPIVAFIMAMLFFSLAGIPPLAGFFAKFYVFLAAVEAGLFALAVIGVLSSVVGAYYYLRVIKIMYFDEPTDDLDPMPVELQAIFGVSGIFVIFFFAFPGPLVAAAGAAARSLF